MITCPYCGTNYAEFRSECSKCGGVLPLPAEQESGAAQRETLDAALEAALGAARGAVREQPPVPPPPPRNVPASVAWRILGSDGWAVVGLVLGVIGAVFAPVGIALTAAVVTAPVGVPFAALGLLFLAFAVPVLVWRYRTASETVEVLRQGQPALGQIVSVSQNLAVRVNGRHPWTIRYRFEVEERSYEGQISTLSQPGLSQQPGRPAYVLYMAAEPEQNSIYPNPYGYGV